MRLKLAYTNLQYISKYDFNIEDIRIEKLCHSKMLLRFQEKAVSSQISCIIKVNFGRTTTVNANDKQAPVYCILKQNVKHMVSHVLLEVRIAKVKERTFVSDLNLIS